MNLMQFRKSALTDKLSQHVIWFCRGKTIKFYFIFLCKQRKSYCFQFGSANSFSGFHCPCVLIYNKGDD